MFQKIMIIGNLGRDPELRYTPQGSPVCNFDVATNKGKGDEQVTCWFRVTAWGSLAENCNQYLAKGRQVLVEGELRPDPETGGPRTWTRNDGTAGPPSVVRSKNWSNSVSLRRSAARARLRSTP